MRVHARLACSEVNGPGRRAVIWVQGCSLGCKGCFNPETHSTTDVSDLVLVTELSEWVTKCGVDGLTISGGEPLQQLLPVLRLGEAVRALGQTVVVFTGYQKQYVEKIVSWESLAKSCDVLITGPYISKLHSAEGLRGSLNKEYVFLSDRYSAKSFDTLNDAEVTIDREGHIHVTGMKVPTFGHDKADKSL